MFTGSGLEVNKTGCIMWVAAPLIYYYMAGRDGRGDKDQIRCDR
jgi:hypothetical protein